MKQSECLWNDELYTARWRAKVAIMYCELLKEKAQDEGIADLEPMKTKIAEAGKAAETASAKYYAIAAEKEGKTNE